MSRNRIHLIFLCMALGFLSIPSIADFDFSSIAKNSDKNNLTFAKGTVGSVIIGATNQIYMLKVNKGQRINLTMNSAGMRAGVHLFLPAKKELGHIYDSEDSKNFEYEADKAGIYHLFCYGGPTFHTYDFIVRVD